MCRISQDLKFTPGECIFNEYEVNNCGIYLIIEGEVELLHA